MKIKSILSGLTVLISTFLLLGCNMNNPLVLEMEAAYKLPSSSSTESNKNVSKMISERFPSGMTALDALHELKKNDFYIGEINREGSRTWPDGEFKRFTDEEIKQKVQKNYARNQTNYSASYDYWVSPLEKRKAVIQIETDGKVILSSRSAIYSRTF